jgi:hypothetical protein
MIAAKTANETNNELTQSRTLESSEPTYGIKRAADLAALH